MTRTPLRVSLFGGGTDYPAYFKRAPGAVIGFTINKHIYISALPLETIQDYKYRVAYSQVEHTLCIDDIRHPIVRCVLKALAVDGGMDVNVVADLPAGGGLGSSSAFTVGFLSLIRSQLGHSTNPMELAKQAIHVEQVLLGETVGVQDQLHAAYGGVTRFDFNGDDDFQVKPIALSFPVRSALNRSLVLIPTGVIRRASASASTTVDIISNRTADSIFERLFALVSECEHLLQCQSDILPDLGAMLDEGWALKREIASTAHLALTDEIYAAACNAGALGGKLCGAGGGGYLAMVVPENRFSRVAGAVSPLPVIPIKIEPHGATLVYSPNTVGEPARLDQSGNHRSLAAPF